MRVLPDHPDSTQRLSLFTNASGLAGGGFPGTVSEGSMGNSLQVWGSMVKEEGGVVVKEREEARA
jgi:hypothetical protein